jgi:NAD(P)-dependent dehydrogenase (short-subunit alcohol dehydrogenase family)
MGRLTGKSVLLVGCATGIGAVEAEMMAREGAAMVLADLNEQGAAKVAEKIKAAGGKAVATKIDLGDEKSINAAVEFAAAAFGGLHVLHNNAAATTIIAERDKPVAAMDPDLWDLTMRINLRGPMLTTKAALPHLRKSGAASIINTASNSGIAGDLGATAYGVSKAGIIALTKYTAAQHGREGVRCNAISPGLIVTDLVRSLWTEEAMQNKHYHEITPRNGEPSDVGNTAIFLASDESAFINGLVINVDGGALSHQPHLGDLFRSGKQLGA